MKKCRTPRLWHDWGQLMEPKIIEQLQQRVVELAQERGVSQGRKMRVNTTVKSTRFEHENGRAQNHHRRPYPLRVMLSGLGQKAHFCDEK
jgi:hypothetical protein